MDEAINLGGNIKLSGFSEVDSTTMIIVKKIVGNIAREFQEKEEFEELHLDLSTKDKNTVIKANFKGNKKLTSEATESNLFFAINKALSEIKNNQ